MLLELKGTCSPVEQLEVNFILNGDILCVKYGNEDYYFKYSIYQKRKIVLSLMDNEQKTSGIKENLSCLYSMDDHKKLHALIDGNEFFVEPQQRKIKHKNETKGSYLSPMPGKIIKVLKKESDEVCKGEPIMVLEAMKMEHTIIAPYDGRIKKIFYNESDQVGSGVQLLDMV